MAVFKQIDFTLNGMIAGERITPQTNGDAPSYDESELNAAIAKGTSAWADVPDAVAWVREQRGGARE
jgi:hypothetical protein